MISNLEPVRQIRFGLGSDRQRIDELAAPGSVRPGQPSIDQDSAWEPSIKSNKPDVKIGDRLYDRFFNAHAEMKIRQLVTYIVCGDARIINLNLDNHWLCDWHIRFTC
jgi:hypothetical protein